MQLMPKDGVYPARRTRTTLLKWGAGCTIVVLGLSSQAASQLEVAAPQPSHIIPAGQIELARLVDLAAQELGLSVEYDAAALKGSATLRLDAGLSGDELWLLVNRVLASRGFTTVRMAGDAAYSVVRLADAPNLAQVAAAPPTTEPARGPPAGYQAIVVRTQHRAAKDLVDPLSKALSKPAGSVTALGDSILLVADLSPRLDLVTDLLGALDAPAAIAAVEEVKLSNLSGEQMTTLVAQVAAKRRAQAGREAPGDVLPGPDARAVLLVAPESEMAALRALVEELDRREGAETVTYAPAHFPAQDVASLIEQSVQPAADDRWRLVIDQLTGSLVVTATPAVHEAVRALIERLDSVPPSARRPVRTFVIKNRSVVDVQEILERLMEAGVLHAAAEQPAPQPEAAPAEQRAPEVIPMPPAPAQPADEGASASRRQPGGEPRPSPGRSGARGEGPALADPPLVLTSDEGTNTLIAVGEPRLLAQVESLLEALDVRQPQVMLEVLMVTLTESQSRDLGVELRGMFEAGTTTFSLASLFGLGSPSLTGAGSGSQGAGFTGLAIDPGDFAALLRALETINDGRSLSMPRLLVSNNQEASLDSVLQQPFASVNASQTISTTSFGGTQDAGTTVSITPQIAEGDHLLLEYSVSLSSFQGSGSDILPPPRQQNQVSSAATIPDGYTVVVGGIDIEDRSKGVSQVPLLGDIPLLGEAFKSRRRTSSRSRFYIFIRANILRHRGFEDLKYLSDGQVEAAGLDDGWPKVEVRIIR
jgi:general secretion pathway protein D